jgi:hypothetical protein
MRQGEIEEYFELREKIGKRALEILAMYAKLTGKPRFLERYVFRAINRWHETIIYVDNDGDDLELPLDLIWSPETESYLRSII